MMKTIESKQEFYRLSKLLLLGNRLTQWTPAEYRTLYEQGQMRNRKQVGIRHTGVAFRNLKSYRTTPAEAYALSRAGGDILIDEAADDSLMTFQGELMADYEGLYTRYSTRQCHQRELWESGEYRHARGLRASQLLQQYMDDRSWDDINRILREYCYPVIEFACFSRSVGVMSSNTIVWEVRTNY